MGLNDSLLCRVDGGLILQCRVEVVPIQVLALCIQAVIAPVDTVGVEHGYDFEHKSFPQYASLLALLTGEEVDDAVEQK